MPAKSVEVDISVSGDVDSKARLDAIDKKATDLRAAFGPAYELKINAAAATQRMAVFRAQFKTVTDAVGKAQDVQILTAKATAKLEDIRVKADKLRAEFPSFTAKIDTAEAERKLAVLALDAKATTDRINKEISGAGGPSLGSKILGLIPGVGGGGSSGASGGAGSAASAASSGGGVLSNPYVLTGAVAAGLVALPFAAQAAAGGITLALGGALAAMAVYGASKTKSVVASFDTLKTSASADLVKIGASFVGPLNNILATATSVMNKLTPVFAGAEKTISGPFQVFSDTLIKTFASPAVKTSIEAVATAFGKLLTALSPSLAQDASAIASGVTKLANAVSSNPDAFRNFISFLSDTVGGALTAIAGLTKFASYIEAHFIPAFIDARNKIEQIWAEVAANQVSTWNAIWANTIGKAIQGGHSVEAAYNTLKAALATALGAVRTGAATAWSAVWSDTVSKVTNGINAVVTWFKGLPGKVGSALSSLGSTLAAIGKGAMSSLLSGFVSVGGSILSWAGNFAKSILNAIGSPFGVHFSEPSVSTVFHKLGAQIMQGLINGIESKVTAAVSHAAAAAKAVTGALGSAGAGGGGATGGGGGAIETLMKSMAAARGWTGAQWTALNNVEMREAGYNLTAQNPSSGAYGLAQFINGPSEYAQYGGNANTAAGQITAMLNYVSQRYGTPSAAWAHEQAYGWYGSGLDAMFSRPTLIGVGERGPERVTVTPSGGGGQDQLIAEIRALRAAVDHVADVAGAIPRATGQHVGAVVNGVAAQGSFNRRYR